MAGTLPLYLHDPDRPQDNPTDENPFVAVREIRTTARCVHLKLGCGNNFEFENMQTLEAWLDKAGHRYDRARREFVVDAAMASCCGTCRKLRDARIPWLYR